MTPAPGNRRSLPDGVLYVVFWTSGAAAITYQLVWQRVLLGIFGADVAAVTIVVTGFMAGLGIGSLAGGALSQRGFARMSTVFAVIEIGIGAFGLVSIRIFHAVGEWTASWPTNAGLFVALLVLLVPTTLMGATLPVLVTHVLRRISSVGNVVGRLYFVNTLGSAVGAVIVVFFVIGPLGQLGSVTAAALLNLVAGVVVLRWA